MKVLRDANIKNAITPCRTACVWLSIAQSVYTFLWIGVALVSRNVLNSVLAGEGEAVRWCVLLVILSAAIPVLRLLTTLYSGKKGDEGVSALRLKLIDTLRCKDCESVNRYHSGYLFSRLSFDARLLCDRYVSQIPNICAQVVQLIGSAAAIAYLKPPLAAVVIVCALAATVLSVWLRKMLKVWNLRVSHASEKMTSCLQEYLEHQEINRVIADPSETARRFGGLQKVWRRLRRSLRLCSQGGSFVFSLFTQLGSAALIIWGVWSIRGGDMNYGDLTAMIQLLNLFRTPITSLTNVQGQLAAVSAAEERISQIWDLPEEERGEPLPKGTQGKAIVFDHVTFSYAGEPHPVFTDFSARIPFGTWTCLTGISGKGKSTLYRLILALYRPQSGRIYIETDHGDFPVSAETRKMFAMVPQLPTLFSGTVRDNLLLVKPDATDEELIRVLNLAECRFLTNLPDGLSTVLGESGDGLSAGQRQRISIARALLTDAQMLLLDEVTSALDRETERSVLKQLLTHFPSALIATHRPDMLKGEVAEHLNLETVS